MTRLGRKFATLLAALALWMGLIALSVLTTWQHHFIDLPTGWWLGWFCVWLFPHEGRSPLASPRELGVQVVSSPDEILALRERVLAVDLVSVGEIDRAIALLDRVRIASAATRFGDYPHQFSGGQRGQRVVQGGAAAQGGQPPVRVGDPEQPLGDQPQLKPGAVHPPAPGLGVVDRRGVAGRDRGLGHHLRADLAGRRPEVPCGGDGFLRD